MKSSDIRNAFIRFFEEKKHRFVPSSPVAPLDDPTLLFTNAGMNQFKPIFLGENKHGLTRAVNSQKCIRVSGKHNDLEEVGKDTYHHTFFEMLGNWSFGDYYKKEAIAWAWELLTRVWNLPKERLFATVYRDDDEAAQLWASQTDINPEHILKFGEKDNFWEMGDTGPCGPCSEIHFDTGDKFTQAETFKDKILGVNGENDRYIEIWNLVFIQYERQISGALKPLKARHVDTGMGFERITAILQGVDSNYEADIFKPLIEAIAAKTGVPYSKGREGTPHRVIADHIRTLTFAITDGAVPANEGRGYVLRRILRRASRFARKLEQTKPLLCQLAGTVAGEMGDAFPELRARQDFVAQVIRAEEERFIKTLDQGLERFRKVKKNLEDQGNGVIAGLDAFTLHDTYGFPLDLTCQMAEEEGLTVDRAGFEKCMAEQHNRARNGAKFDNALANDENWTILAPQTSSKFTGYQGLTGTGRLLRHREEKGVTYVVLDKTPFYAESGGQVGDTGLLTGDGIKLRVSDSIPLMDMTVHKCKLLEGALPVSGDCRLEALVDGENREATVRNHSATHLMQAALRQVLGTHVQQQGSRVSPQSLRFDFTHFQAMTPQEITKVEDLVNLKIREALDVRAEISALEEARSRGAMALFGEKYGDRVRLIQIADFSLELCGGTHVTNTGQIGLFKIVEESSIASGVRRIEALTGRGALTMFQEQTDTLSEIRQSLKIKPGKEALKMKELLEQSRRQEKELESLRMTLANAKAGPMLESAKTVGNCQVILARAGGMEKKELNALADSLADKLINGVAVITNAAAGSLSILVIAGKEATGKVHAGKLVKTLAELAGGKGGGRPDRAQAGSRSPEKEPLVLQKAEEMLNKLLA